VIGVYIYPAADSGYDARALSWVRKSQRLASDWPVGSVEYAPRPH
jgi:hypothetical protein